MIEEIYPIFRTIDDHIDNYEAIGIEGKYGSDQHLC